MSNVKSTAASKRASQSDPDAAIVQRTPAAIETGSGGTDHLVNRINADTRGVLVLFPFTPRSIEEGKAYPVMTGHLDTKNVKVSVSAFARKTDEGREFLSLAIGPQGQAHIGGALFRQEEQNPINGTWERTPGKEMDRFGLISKQVKVAGTEEYEAVYQLRFYGRARVTAAGVPYIKANVYPERRELSPAGFDAMDGCF
jgi:uncharacterized protein (DUF736 family)